VRIYFAGPLFTPYERAYIDECAARLRSDGHDVFVPHEHELATRETSPDAIFAKDIGGLGRAEAAAWSRRSTRCSSWWRPGPEPAEPAPPAAPGEGLPQKTPVAVNPGLAGQEERCSIS
jgi:Nucleoside 2-deoxyribosyltransferase